MFTPLIGGAEQQLKDLLQRVDRTKFDVTLLYESWPAFDRFLEDARHPDVKFVAVPVVEPTGHAPAKTPLSSKGDGGAEASVFEGLVARSRAAVKNASPRVKNLSKGLFFPVRVALAGWNAFVLWRAIRKAKLDVLHIINGGYPGSETAQLAAIVAKHAGCASVVMTVSNTPVPPVYPEFAERWKDERIRRAVDAVDSVGPSIGRELIARRGFLPERMHAVPYGIFPPEELLAKASLAGYGIDEQGRPLIVQSANLTEVKRIDRLIAAVDSLRATFPQVRALVLGGGALEGELRADIAHRGLENHVTLVGRIPYPDVRAIMAAADVVTLTSEQEGLALSVIEAMSVGRPVIAPRIPGLTDLVVDGVTGLLYDRDDAESLVRAFVTLLSDEGMQERFSKAARARYESTFTIGAMVAGHEAIYRRLFENSNGNGAGPSARRAPR